MKRREYKLNRNLLFLPFNYYQVGTGCSFVQLHLKFWQSLVIAETLDPEVKILSLAIKSHGRDDILLQIPENGKVKGNWFTLKEGCRYSLQFAFLVNNNIVSGLKYTNTVWKTGVKGKHT